MMVLRSLVLAMWMLGAPQSQQPSAPVDTPSIPTSLPSETAPAVLDPAKPFPNVKSLLNDVEHNELLGEKIRAQYTYHVHVSEEDFDGKGNTKKTEVTDSESLTIDGIRVNRAVAKNGKPLTDDEKKKEDERIDKQVAEEKKERNKRQSKGQETADNGAAIITAERFLELGSFTNPRRELLNGRATLLFDYAGDPKAKTKNEMEGVIKDLVGTVWIDELDHVLVKAEGHFLKDFKVGAGLVANIHGGLRFSVAKQKINNEVWLPTTIYGEGSARILLFVKINGKVNLHASDFRKFRTGSTIVPSYRVIGPNGEFVPDPPETPAPPKP